MSESLYLLFILKEFLPSDLTKLIIRVYIYLPQKFKPGQIVFEVPCRHQFRFLLKRDNKSLFYPNGKIHFNKATAKASSLHYEIFPGTTLSCKRCNYHQYFAATTTFNLSIICFCNKITDRFPCGTCSATKCSVQLCVNIASGREVPILCKKHMLS
uniref:Uncharacterized protein n=1 Tax=viral metagenome TaxID=1070528 RepID=A0A6C0C7K0_9ZZZZ